MAWTDEEKEDVIKKYTSQNPTPENSIELVEEIAEELDKSTNGVRMILTKAGVYVKKTPAKNTKSGAKGTRVSKEDAQSALTDAINDAGQTADEDIIGKLTGKAAVYFKTLIDALND